MALRLKQILESKGVLFKGCAASLGITEKTLYNKMNGISEFTYSEYRTLKDILPEYNIDYLLEEYPDN